MWIIPEKLLQTIFRAHHAPRSRFLGVPLPNGVFSNLKAGTSVFPSVRANPLVKGARPGSKMTPKNVYLVLYNSIQVSLWSTVLVYLITAFKGDFPLLHNATALEYATRAQTLAWLEVIHAAVGFGGGISTAFVQCLGRYVVLVFVINAVPPIQHTVLTSLLLLSWSVADVIRYSFYISSFAGGPGKVVLWLRYSMFLMLYPFGIASEWLIYYYTLDFIDSNHLYRIELPNSWNFAFDFGAWNRFVLALYFYFGPYMLLHMMRQRKRKLS